MGDLMNNILILLQIYLLVCVIVIEIRIFCFFVKRCFDEWKAEREKDNKNKIVGNKDD